ncbi:MAG: translation initiation factor IF-2 N-terminal domain-containing protein, partial [Gemmatimonadota bacterium]
MRVYEVAKEFDVPPESLIHLLREMSVSVSSEASPVSDSDVAKLRALFERQRRAGATGAEEILESAIEDAQTATTRR